MRRCIPCPKQCGNPSAGLWGRRVLPSPLCWLSPASPAAPPPARAARSRTRACRPKWWGPRGQASWFMPKRSPASKFGQFVEVRDWLSYDFRASTFPTESEKRGTSVRQIFHEFPMLPLPDSRAHTRPRAAHPHPPPRVRSGSPGSGFAPGTPSRDASPESPTLGASARPPPPPTSSAPAS